MNILRRKTAQSFQYVGIGKPAGGTHVEGCDHWNKYRALKIPIDRLDLGLKTSKSQDDDFAVTMAGLIRRGEVGRKTGAPRKTAADPFYPCNLWHFEIDCGSVAFDRQVPGSSGLLRGSGKDCRQGCNSLACKRVRHHGNRSSYGENSGNGF